MIRKRRGRVRKWDPQVLTGILLPFKKPQCVIESSKLVSE